MNKGETLELILNYEVDGSPIQKGEFDDIKLTIGGVTLSRKNGQIKWDENEQKYIAKLTPSQTQGMPDIALTRLTIEVLGNTYLSDVGKLGFARSI